MLESMKPLIPIQCIMLINRTHSSELIKISHQALKCVTHLYFLVLSKKLPLPVVKAIATFFLTYCENYALFCLSQVLESMKRSIQKIFSIQCIILINRDKIFETH